MIPAPPRQIVDENGDMTQEMLIWVDIITNLQYITGTGSPEGVVGALPTRKYMDTAGTTGAIDYIKRDADDGAGDDRFGWILV